MLKRILSHLPWRVWRWPKKYLAILIILILGLGWYFLKPSKKAEPIQTVAIKKEDIRTTVSASGTLSGADFADLRFKLGGKLAYLNIKQGDTVTKGQVIAGLDTQELNIALQQAQNNWLSKDATAKRTEDDVKNHASDETLTQREERISAQTARDSAFDAIKDAKRNFQDAVIVSPISGIVTRADPTPGQTVSPSDLIAEVVDDSAIYFDAEVDEADIGKISISENSEVSLNSYPDSVFKGTVEKITPFTKTTSSGATVIVVRINLGKPSINFVAGLNGQAEIIQTEHKNVLSLPQEAVKEDNTVIVKVGNSYQSKKVSTGIKSDSNVEITSGLKEGELVVTNPSAVPSPKGISGGS